LGARAVSCDAERLTLEQAVKRILDIKPRLVVFVVYGQNPNSGTTGMIGGLALAQALKHETSEFPICFVGSHTSAMPMEVLGYDCVDIVLQNEGVYALLNLLKSNLRDDLQHIKGIGYKKAGAGESMSPTLNPPQSVVPQERMDEDMPATPGTCFHTGSGLLTFIGRIFGMPSSVTKSVLHSRQSIHHWDVLLVAIFA
jgi:anaerobic magnesium-protoporphyrin IX monomethyl ester cyclase